MAASVEVTELTEQPLRVLAAQVARLLDPEADQLLRDGRTDVR